MAVACSPCPRPSLPVSKSLTKRSDALEALRFHALVGVYSRRKVQADHARNRRGHCPFTFVHEFSDDDSRITVYRTGAQGLWQKAGCLEPRNSYMECVT